MPASGDLASPSPYPSHYTFPPENLPRILGIEQPHVSSLVRNRPGSFSMERLMEFLTALGQDVEITGRPTCKQHGEMSVVA